MSTCLRMLAPSKDRGWAHVGPVGAGHFTKMIHNGIEYGMMQAYAEGLDLLRGKEEFGLVLAQITELWRHSSVVRSWLLDLTAEALDRDQELKSVAPFVADSGEGRWTAIEAIDQGAATPVMTLALQMRFASQDEGNTVLLVVANLQTRVDELETKLTDVGLLLSAENGTMRGVKLQGVKIQL